MPSKTIPAIEAWLREIRGRWRATELGRRTGQVIIGLAAWTLVLHSADMIIPLSIAVRSVMLPVNFVTILTAIGYAAIPLFNQFPLDRAARLVEARLPSFRQELSTAWEWARKTGPDRREQYSADLINALQQRALGRLRSADPAELFPASRSPWPIAACALLLAAIVIAVSPAQFGLTAQRFLHPSGVCGDWDRSPVSPGSVRIAAGRSLRITAGADGFDVVWTSDNGSMGRARSADGLVDLLQIRRNTVYRIMRGREQSPAYSVTVYQPLELEGLRVRVTPPAYARLTETVQENQGDVSGLKGSRVTVTATATQALAQAGLSLDGGVLVPGAITHDCLVAVSFTLNQPGAYRLWARSVTGDSLIDPQHYSILVQEDAFPTVELTAPEIDQALRPSLAVAVEGRAGDDVGLSLISLVFEAQGERSDALIARITAQVTDTSFAYRWDLGSRCLMPGDSVVYWLEARDNDDVSGPKTARSPKRLLRLPTLEDFFKQQELADSAVVRGFERAEPVNSDLRRELERLSQAIKETRGVEWQQKAAIEDALKQEQQLMTDLQQTAEQALAAMRNDQNRFSFDRETVQKMEELRQLFDQAATAEMRQYVEKMRQAVEKADRNAVEKALENLKLSQEEFKQRLDATIASLKQLQQEQQVDLLNKQADQLLREQKALKAQSADSKTDSERQQLARRQDALAKDTDALALKMSERAGALEQNDPEAARPLRNAADLLRNNQTSSTMRQAGQELRQRQMEQAGVDQDRAISDLAQAAAGARQAKSGMRSQRSKAAAQALRQKASEIVRLSRQQESLNQRLDQMHESRNDLADDQQSLERAAARMAQDLERMGGKAIPLPPQAGAAMAQAGQRMRAAGQRAAEGAGQQAGQEGKGAQAALNQAALALMQSASRGGSSGSGDMSEDMEGLSSRQQSLNQQTGQMAEQQQELQLQAMQGQIPRLAAEQAAIRQGLQQFNEQYAGRADRTGRTDDLVREMEKVIEDLKSGRITRETTQRQEKILTRMLDAQRSLQERDFSRQRQSDTGRDAPVSGTAGPDIPGGQPWTRYRVWRDWRAEPYPPEYRQMLENYFRSLGQ